MNTRVEEAIERKKHCNCVQAVLSTYCDLTGVDEATSMRLCQGLGAGMGNMEGTCGAVVGACIAYSLIAENKGAAMQGSKQIMEKFKERNGSTQCRALKGVDTKVVLRECPMCVADACEFLEELINAEKK